MGDELQLKVLVVGAPAVGKTALIRRLAGKPFSSAYSPTLGFDLSVVQHGALAGLLVSVQLWEVGQGLILGDEGFDHQRIMVSEVAGVFFVLDATEEESLVAIDRWRELLSRNAQASRVPWILLSQQGCIRTSFTEDEQVIRLNKRPNTNKRAGNPNKRSDSPIKGLDCLNKYF